MDTSFKVIYCPVCLKTYGKKHMLLTCSTRTVGEFYCYCKHCKLCSLIKVN